MGELELDIKAAKIAIEDIGKTDYRLFSIEDLENKLTPLFKGLKSEVPRYETGLELYRGTDLGRKPQNISEVSFPPEDKVKKMGRLNGVGESIFYGATARSVPFFELNRKAGDHICISKWVTSESTILNHVGFSRMCQDSLNSNRQFESLYQFVEATKNFSEENKVVYDFVAYAFSRKVSELEYDYYKLTNAIGRKLVGKNGLIAGIMFPTIAMNGNADNIVLGKEFAKQGLKLKSVEYIYVKSAKGFEYEIDVIDTSVSFDVDGTIKWNGRPWNYTLTKPGGSIIMKAENGQWVAYDQCGKKVDPS